MIVKLGKKMRTEQHAETEYQKGRGVSERKGTLENLHTMQRRKTRE